ncbi:MAG TPA: MarC family protein [Phycisphaerae bacterium]|nr:MarC family protein [Phycisphaerae bacterium]
MKTLHDFLLIFLPLFVVIDPAGSLPVYLALTSQYTEEQRHKIAIRATIVASITGILFVILGQAIFTFLGVQFADFQIAGGILLVILATLDLLRPGKPAVNEKAPLDPAESIGVFPLAVPLIVGPATMTTSLLLVNAYAGNYNERFGAPYGQILVVIMVCTALVLNLAILFTAMWYSSIIVAVIGRNAMKVVNKIVMILLAAIAVSLIRRGIVSIVEDIMHGRT